MTHNSIIAMAAFAAIVAVPTVAEAQQPVTVVTAPDDETRFARVSYGDLDLASSAGQNRLQRRVGTAASKICKDSQPPVADLAFNACRANAVRDAGPQVAAAIEMAMQRQYSDRGAAPPEIIVR